MKRKLPEVLWLTLFCLPSFLIAIIQIVLNKDILGISAEGNHLSTVLWLIPCYCYLLVLSVFYGRQKEKRGFKLAVYSITITLGLIVVNAIVFGTVLFAGCVCAFDKFSPNR